ACRLAGRAFAIAWRARQLTGRSSPGLEYRPRTALAKMDRRVFARQRTAQRSPTDARPAEHGADAAERKPLAAQRPTGRSDRRASGNEPPGRAPQPAST